jgi:prepilin-type processing-associated H-X9-DG protein
VTKGVPMPVAPAWCLTDKYFVVSLFPQSLKAALLKMEAGKDGSLLAGDSLGAQLAGPAKGASAVFYCNQRQLLRIIYPVALPVWQVGCSMAAKAGISMDVNALPRLDLLLKYVTDSYGAVIPDPEGVLMTNRDATPLAPLVLMGATPVMVLSLQQAMQQANRIRSRANLSGCAKGLQIYANGHNGDYPDSLQELVAEGFSPQMMRIPSKPELAYVYLKPGKDPVDNSTKWVVAFEPPEVNGGDGANVLFLDGHADWVRVGELNELLKAQGFKTPLAAPPAKREPEVPAGTNPI